MIAATMSASPAAIEAPTSQVADQFGPSVISLLMWKITSFIYRQGRR